MNPNVLLVAVDCQYDFVMADGKLPVDGGEAIITPGIKMLSKLDPEEIAGVLFTYDTHDVETYIGNPENLGDSNAGVPGFPVHCERNTPGWQIVFNPSLIPDGIPVHTLLKGVFDMWIEQPDENDVSADAGWINHVSPNEPFHKPSTGTMRDRFFGQPGGDGGTARKKGVDTVRIIGLASDYCVAWAASGFLDRGYKVEIVRDLVAGIGMDIDAVVAERFAGRATVV